MDIIIADKAGFCFGVSNIDNQVEESLKQDQKQVYSYGSLIHNDQYVERRKSQGLIELNSLEEAEAVLNDSSLIILRAHGVLKEERERLEATGAQIVDGTCPVLLSIYKKAIEKNKEGKQIIIIGDKDHPEVRAMASYFDDDTLIVGSKEEADAVVGERPLYIISQTTNRRDFYDDLAEAVASKNPDAELNPTICNATKERQGAAKKLAAEVDAMVVIGGNKSSNTEKLVQVSRKVNKNTVKVEKFDDLALQNTLKFTIIGVTAGASTPDWIIEEVVKGMDNFSKEDFMEQIEDSMVKIYPKDIVKGDVLAVKDDEVFVDIHYRSDGIIKLDEMSEEERENPKEAFHEEEEIDVYVIKLDDGEGNVVLSTRRVEGLKNWKKLVELYENDETVEAKVTGDNSGGLVVNVMGINGFIPASQITTYYVKNFKQFVGQTLECKIISIDERKRNLVLSSRAVKEEQLDEVWESIVVGQTIKGEVVRMTDFGAFVDLGGVDGLIHVSDISWQRIDKPSDELEIGQEVEPLVLKANRDRNRISLGLKQLTPKPFDVFVENNEAGDAVQGEIVNLVDFGAFVRLKEGVEGLVHVSQIANHHVEKPADELTLGDTIDVKILDIEEDRQRIALSIRALLPQEEKTEETDGGSKRDFSKFERKEKPEQKQQPRREKQAKQKVEFDSSSDIGTNLGDLIAAQLNLVDEDSTEDDIDENQEETNVENSAEEVAENEVEDTEAEVEEETPETEETDQTNEPEDEAADDEDTEDSDEAEEVEGEEDSEDPTEA